MRALPEIETMAAIGVAGASYVPYLRTTDHVERMVHVVVADRMLEIRHHNSEQRIKALSAQIGSKVGSVVGKALSAALQSIARAMRG